MNESVVIFSIDVDVGNPELGLINHGSNDLNVNKTKSEYAIGKIDQLALPIFIDVFEQFEVPVTFALRGQLTELEVPSIDCLLDSSVKHDIAAHGYSHKKFENLSHDEAEAEIRLASEGLRKMGISPCSFVFPANSVNHLDILDNFGYKCYRGTGGITKDVMSVHKVGSLINVCPSIYLQNSISPLILNQLVNLSVVKRLPLHLWLHLWNMGWTKDEIQKNIERIIIPFLTFAKKSERNGNLTFETMASAARKVA